jgi:hypothetical protein
MIRKVRYYNGSPLNLIEEEFDDEIIDAKTYCDNIHLTKLCSDINCNHENCKIWVKHNGDMHYVRNVFNEQ